MLLGLLLQKTLMQVHCAPPPPKKHNPTRLLAHVLYLNSLKS
jgi:hypothetical protein